MIWAEHVPWPMVALLYAVAVLTLVVAVVSLILIRPIVFPRIITFPWDDVTSKENKTVILAGSYNPPHKGHLKMLEYLSSRYERVIAVIGFNPDKTYKVLPSDRAKLLREMLTTSDSAQGVEVEVVEGFIWRFAHRIGASVFFRGIRSWEKDGADERSLQILNTWGPLILGPVWPIPTVYLEGHPDYNHVSSTLIREICSKDERETESKVSSLSGLVTSNIAPTVAKLYAQKDQ